MVRPRPLMLSPSILSADMSRLAEQVALVESAGAELVHVDVMDGRFVPNLTVGLPVVQALSRVTRLPLDVHLMIEEPERYVEDFARAGASIICVHAEASCHLYRTLQAIRAAGRKPAVSLCPATPLAAIEEVLELVDMVLIMTVEPGFAGQRFLSSQLGKVKRLAELCQRRGLDIDIEVDGGINSTSIAEAARAGANVFVAGTSVFGAADPARAVEELKAAARAALG